MESDGILNVLAAGFHNVVYRVERPKEALGPQQHINLGSDRNLKRNDRVH